MNYSDLFPFQKQAVDFMLKGRGRMLLLQQGLGKTPVSICAADRIKPKRIAVVCPAIGRMMWQDAVPEWSAGPAAEAEWVVKSYHYFSNGHRLDGEFDLLILDEVHYLQSPESKRTQAIYSRDGLIRQARRLWILSGTLAPGRIHQLYPHLRVMAAKRLPANTKEQFMARYYHWVPDFWGGGHYGDVKRERLPELAEVMRPFTFRRTKKQVLPDLPPLNYVHNRIKTDDALATVRRTDNTLDDETLAFLQHGTIEELDNNPQWSSLRRVVGIAKAPSVAELAVDALEDGLDKLVIFYWHKDVGLQLAARLASYGCARIGGDTSAAHRRDIEHEFQTGSELRVIVGQITACGTTITLTASSDVWFAEASVVPAENEQAAMRCHRIGTVNPVTARFLSLAGTVDDAVMGIARNKARELQTFWDHIEGVKHAV